MGDIMESGHRADCFFSAEARTFPGGVTRKDQPRGPGATGGINLLTCLIDSGMLLKSHEFLAYYMALKPHGTISSYASVLIEVAISTFRADYSVKKSVLKGTEVKKETVLHGSAYGFFGGNIATYGS